MRWLYAPDGRRTSREGREGIQSDQAENILPSQWITWTNIPVSILEVFLGGNGFRAK